MIGGNCDIEAHLLGGMRVDPHHNVRGRGHRYERCLFVDGKTIALGLVRKRTGRSLGVALKGIEAKVDAVEKCGVLGRLTAVSGSKERLGSGNPGQRRQRADNSRQRGEQTNRFP